MPLFPRHRRLSWSQRLFALAAALWVLVQVSGLQQLCFCGGCEVSRVLAQWLPDALAPQPAGPSAADEHPCCAQARRDAEREWAQRDHWSSEEQDCGCGDRSHQWQAWTAAVDAPGGWQPPEMALVHAQPLPNLAQRWPSLPTDQALFSRGPPLQGDADLYLAQQRLLI
jgi:hypothetical protein